MRAETRFAAMGSEVHVVVAGGRAPALLTHARARIEELEARWIRFRAGADGVCVNVGGDLRVEGRLGQAPWAIEVAGPFDGSRLALLSLRAGAVATTSRVKRAWDGPEGRRHHLIDPRTGRPAATGLASATAVAAEAWQAEVAAKASFLAGPDEGVALLEADGVECLLVADDGTPIASVGLGRFMLEEAPA